MIYGSGYNQGIGMGYNPLVVSPQGSGIPLNGGPGYNSGISGIGYTGPSSQQAQQGVGQQGLNTQLGQMPDWAQQYIDKNAIQKSDENYSQGKVEDFQRQSAQGYQALAQKYGQDVMQNPYFMQQGVQAQGFNPFQDATIDSYKYSYDPIRNGIIAQDTQMNAFTGAAMGGPKATDYFYGAPQSNQYGPMAGKMGNNQYDSNDPAYLSAYNAWVDKAKSLGAILPTNIGYYKGGAQGGGGGTAKGILASLNPNNYAKSSYAPQQTLTSMGHNYPYGGY